MSQIKDITLTLSKDEALVLFEFLARFTEKEDNTAFADKSEELVLWNIEGQLERTLTEPLLPNYDVLLIEARKNVQANY